MSWGFLTMPTDWARISATAGKSIHPVSRYALPKNPGLITARRMRRKERVNMNLNINDKAWFSRHPQFATMVNAVLMIFAATGCGIIAERGLQMYFDIAPLGIWSVFAIAGSALAATVRLHAVLIAIALGEEPVTTHDAQGQPHHRKVNQNTPVERATASISETFQPVTYLISIGILAAVSVLVTQQYPDIAAQLTPSWAKSYPVSIAAFASATGIVLTNAKTVARLLGRGYARTCAIKAGKVAAIATSIGLTGLAFVGLIGFIILFI